MPPAKNQDQECSQPNRASRRASLRSQFAPSSSKRPPTDTDAWPVHPIPALRGPFDESIAEAMDPDFRVRRTLDAAARRLQLLELDEFPEDYSSRWRAKPGAKFHPLWKLIAQISFGIHLLHQHTAKSEEEVIRILQTHIDEVDGFLEDTHADFDLAIKDILERARLLQLSLDHGKTFGRMLRNDDFRKSVLDGNDIIHRIILRTTRALDTSMEDVSKGTEATAEFAKYLDRVKLEWTRNNEDMEGVYEAMRGNAEGWYCCFEEVDDKAQKLRELMEWLRALVKEVTRRSGIAERKVIRQATGKAQSQDSLGSRRPSHTATQRQREQQQGPPSPSMSTRSKKSLRMSMSKPLPPDPNNPDASRRDPTRRSYAPRPIDPPPPHRSDIRIHRPYPDHEEFSRATSTANSIQHSRRPSHSETQDRRSSRHPETTRSPPLPQQSSPAFTQSTHLSPAQMTPLTPDQMLQMLHVQQQQLDAQNQQLNAQAAQMLGLTPNSTLTPSSITPSPAPQQSFRSSQPPAVSSNHSTPIGSPLTPTQLLELLQAANQNQQQRQSQLVQHYADEGAPIPRSRSSAQFRERDLVMSQMQGDIHVDLTDIAEEGSLHSPLPANMLIPVLPDIRESESLHLGDILIDVPSTAGLANERSPVGSEIPDHEEKQVMSNETFLMLDDIEEESKRSQLLEGLAELDAKKRSMVPPRDAMPTSSERAVMPKWAQLDLVQAEPDSKEPAELDVRKTMNGLDGRKVDLPQSDPKLSRQDTKRSMRSNGSDHRSRPHSSYSVLDAYRKSKTLSSSGGAPNLPGDAEEKPPVPAMPLIVPLSTESATPKTPHVEDAQEEPANTLTLEPVKTRNSSDSAMPQLTKSGSTTSVSSATHKATASSTQKFSERRHDLQQKIEENARTGERAESPVGPAIVDDGLLELIRPRAESSSPDFSKLSRSKSMHPAIQSPREVESTVSNARESPMLFRSSSSKSHKRPSKASLPSNYSNQVTPSMVSPNSTMLQTASPAMPQVDSLISPVGTMLTDASSPTQPVNPSPTQPPVAPAFSRHDSWMSEKVVVVGPPTSDELALLRQSRQAPPPLQSESRQALPPLQSESAPRQMGSRHGSQQLSRTPEQDRLGHSHTTSRGINRKAAPGPLVMAPPTMLVEADHGTLRTQQMITTFTPLSPHNPPDMRPRPATSYNVKPPAPASPGMFSNYSKEALPPMQPAGLKAKRFGTLRRPVNAVRGLFKKHNQPAQ